MVSLSVSSVKNNMLAAYLANKIFPQPRPAKALGCGFFTQTRRGATDHLLTAGTERFPNHTCFFLTI